jgi:hypothetical protein
MGDDFWKWLIGILGTDILGLVGTGKYLQGNINVNAKAVREGDDALHERVNRVRDELARDFVRKSDIDAHLSRIDENWRDLRSEMKDAQKDTIERLDVDLKDIRERLDEIASSRPSVRRRARST